MAKKSKAGMTTLLVLALVIPLGVSNFLLNLVFTVLYLPSIAESITEPVHTAVNIFVPFGLYLLGFIFSLILMGDKPKEKTLPLVALILNGVLVVSGVFFVYSTYFGGM